MVDLVSGDVVTTCPSAGAHSALLNRHHNSILIAKNGEQRGSLGQGVHDVYLFSTTDRQIHHVRTSSHSWALLQKARGSGMILLQVESQGGVRTERYTAKLNLLEP